ncbi:MAG: AIR synthase family protein [Chloroflexota bacterium]
MSEMPDIGKISPEIFNQVIYPRLGAKNPDILVGPQHGVDVGIAEIGGQAVSFKSDPIFIVPEYGWERAAWFAFHILASDSVTCALPPKFFCVDLNLPMKMTREQLTIMWDTIHKECVKYGVAIITGHTARYENCNYPMVGGATIIGYGDKEKYVTPRLARAGDKIIITKGPAIEAVGIFAAALPQQMEKQFGREFAKKAEQIFYKMSVVEDGIIAASVGVRENGVSAMHDATECGIWGALYEMGHASQCGVRVDKDKIVVEECIPEICAYLGIDPYASISEGTLIITCRPHKADAIVKALARKDIKSSIVGELTPPEAGMVLIEKGKEKELKHPIVDPFWKAFYNALTKV